MVQYFPFLLLRRLATIAHALLLPEFLVVHERVVVDHVTGGGRGAFLVTFVDVAVDVGQFCGLEGIVA